MAKHERADVGFDVDRAIETLHGAALAAGVFPEGTLQNTKPHDIANVHLHGLEHRHCTKNPCRTAGLCLALYEVTRYQAELERMKPLLDAAVLTEEARKWLGSVGDRYANTLEALTKYGAEHHPHDPDQGVEGRMLDHTQLCERPVEILQQMTAFLASLDAFDEGLRARFWSRELQQPGNRKRSALLLTAVWQHLDWGGFTYDQIFELVPSFKAPTNVKDIVRKRVREPDARSLLPRELHPALPKPPKVEKQRRRRSST